MKKLLLTPVAAFALTATSALAADLGTPYYKAPPPPPPAVSWTGCYVDGGVGYGLFNQSHYDEVLAPGGFLTGPVTTTTPISLSSNTAGEGWLGRVGGGCDYQFGARFVVGAFADYDFTDFSGTNQDSVVEDVGNEKETGAWAAGGRIGYLVTPSLLTYFDGGYTQARFDSIPLSSALIPSGATGLSFAAQTYDGWFLGGGTEYALSAILPISGLFWRTEYRYAQYQSADVPLVCSSVALCGGIGPTGVAIHSRPDVQTITSGIVWRFNFGGPIATRY